MKTALMIMVFLWPYGQINISNDQTSKRDHSPANGEKYIGSFKRDEIHGFGTYYHKNGEKYTGEFKNNKRHG